MAGWVGGDLEQLQVLESTFTRDAQSVAELQHRITSTLGSTVWQGAASDRFRQEWQGSFVPSLNRLTEALTENASYVRLKKEQNDQVNNL
ncbi:MAG: WXG100 family type VII secretion target [Acidimicrobiia bacterium]